MTRIFGRDDAPLPSGLNLLIERSTNLEVVRVNIDGRDVETDKGKSILQAALDAGIYIPHLCHHPDLSPVGACRLCIVEIEGIEGILPSCATPAENNMRVKTKTALVGHMQRLAMELILAGHPANCDICNKYLNCELQSVKQFLGVAELRVKRRSKPFSYNTNNPLFVRDLSRCIVCGRCARACDELRGVGVLFYRKRGMETYIGSEGDLPLADSGCRFCGACVEVCPTGALRDKEELIKEKTKKAALIPCRYQCPAEIDVPRYIRFIQDGDYSAATAVMREKVPFPKVLGYVCDQPCEAVCRRGAINQPIAIKELKRFAAEHDTERLWETAMERPPQTGKRVGIIGSGPAGLTAAYFLSIKGHSVTVFETLPLAGGMLRYGIPEYRLPKNILDSEIRDIEALGVEISTKRHIESIEELIEEGYDAVLAAVGASKGETLPIPGAENERVLIGIDFLRDARLKQMVAAGKKIFVVGSGKVAIDCARTARRLGPDRVCVICPEAVSDMDASDEEIEEAKAEGVELKTSKAPARILIESGRVIAIELIDVESFGFDENHNVHIETIEHSRHVCEADTVIFAVGQQPDLSDEFHLDTSPRNLIEIDPYTKSTNREGVFAAGDAVSGTASVIRAIASGRETAAAIDSYLGGNGDIDNPLAPFSEPKRQLGPGKGFAALERPKHKDIKGEGWLDNFCGVSNDMGEEAAIYESNRCLQCDLRLKITSIKFWGSY